jgi:heme-degrading monooxygenase HmoA
MSVVEVTTFRLAASVTDAAFLALDKRLQTELVPNRPGFLRRTTARHGDEWLVVTLWVSEADAAAFARETEDDPLQVEFARIVEAGSLHATRYETLD